MNLKKTFSGAAAGVLALALAAGGATVANAAEGDIVKPQPNGSNGSYFIYDGNTGDFADAAVDEAGTVIFGDPNRIYDRQEGLITSASSTDVLAEIMPADYLLPGQNNFTQVWRFVTKPGTEYVDAAQGGLGGTNTWRAFSNSAAAGPNGGVLTDDWTLESKVDGNNGGIESVFTEGGEWSVGIAFTEGNGVQVRGAVWRTVQVEPGTGKFTVDPIVLEGADVIVDPTEADLLPGLEVQGLATGNGDTGTIAINAPALVDGNYRVGAFSTYTNLGTVPFTGGQATVPATGLLPGSTHTLVVTDPANGNVLAWGSFTLTTTDPMLADDSVQLDVNLSASNRFEIIAPAAQVNLAADARRNVETAPVSLMGANAYGFKVIDDRLNLKGWNVNASAAPFTSGANTIATDALGYTIERLGTAGGTVTLGTDKVAGVAGFGAVATGAPLSSTTEAGADFDLKLTFKAPIDSQIGSYGSVLTLDLVSQP